MAMDAILQRRRSAHARAAISHDQSAEFHRAVGEYFEQLGDDLNATRARLLADGHRRRATQERDYASSAMHAPDGAAA